MLKCNQLEWKIVEYILKTNMNYFNSWNVELKIDGSREFWIDNNLVSARGINHNQRYSHVYNALKNIGDCVLDGEIALGENSNVLALNKKENWNKSIFYVFDIIKYDSVDTTIYTLEERRKILDKLILKINSPYVKLIRSFDDIEKAWNYVCNNNLEGLVIKRKSSKYYHYNKDIFNPIRINDWLKIKNWRETKERVVDFIKGSEKGSFILENGSKVSTLENGVGEIFLKNKSLNKKVYAEIFYMMKTSNNRLFQPKLKRLVDSNNAILWESG